MSRIPPEAAPDVQQAFREVWSAVDRLGGAGALNRDLAGRRIINAGRSVGPNDYVTRSELEDVRRNAASARAPGQTTQVFLNLTASGISRLVGPVFIPSIADACIVFTKAGGELSGDEAQLSWRYTNNSLRVGNGATVRWHHGVEMTAPSTTLVLTGEDADATSQFSRILFGPGAFTDPALKRVAGGLEVRTGTDSGYATLRASAVTASQFILTSPSNYNIVNSATDRAYDATATTLAEIANVLATLVGDLEAIGLVS